MIYEILNGETVINTIVATPEFMAQAYPEGNYREVKQPEPPAPPEIRHITVGAFFDRFGDQKWPILADTNPSVQALIKDASVRKWINLDDPQVLAGLQMVQASGHDIDPEAIINAPIQPDERP
jgi:hypothetical protein